MYLKKKLLNELSRKPIWQHFLITLMQLRQPKNVVEAVLTQHNTTVAWYITHKEI